MKAAIVSLDLLAASSIAALAVLLLLASVRASQSYFLSMAEYQNRSMSMISGSQEIAEALASSRANFSVAVSLSNWIASRQGLRSHLSPSADLSPCHSPLSLCRLVTVSGSTYLLVVSYENSSEP